MYGWSDQEALGKKSHLLLQTVTPAGPLNVDGILERDGFWEGEVIYTHKDGRKMTAESRQVLLREPETDTVSILQIDRDITSRLTLENDLKNYSEKLADADHRKNVFLAMLAHAIAIKYLITRRDATTTTLGDQTQTRGTVGIFYTLLGQDRFAGVNWLE